LLLAVVLATAWFTTSASASPKATPTTPAKQAKHAGKRQVSAAFSYDLVTALGAVYNFGGAGDYGGVTASHLAAPIVGMAVAPNGRGYWLVGANGSVFNLGGAAWYGSLASQVLGDWQQIIAIVATTDGKGYWLVNQSGAVIPFGDAQPINGGKALPTADLGTPIVSAAIAPGGVGAWFTDSAGRVFVSGAAPWLGSRVDKQLQPITSIAAIPSGLGYWLTDSVGQVWGFGQAAGAAPAPSGIVGTTVGMIPAQNQFGYWVATSAGSVISGGDAVARSGTTVGATIAGVVSIAAAPRVNPPTLPFGAVGYDINWPQCAASGSSKAGPLPGPPNDVHSSLPYSIAIVGVDGWAVNDYNTCLSAEVNWAKGAVYPAGSGGTGTPPYDLYLFLNSPASDATNDATGPAGTCAKVSVAARDRCIVYNYGYNSTLAAVQYATLQGAHAKVWWLDIENDDCNPGMWNDAANSEWWSCDLSLNAETIQGAIDALRSLGIRPGIYCTSVQWAGITASYMPTGGAPLIWIAGAFWTSPPYPTTTGYPAPPMNTKFCTESQYFFAGGRPVMLQETPGGGNNYPYDPDIAC
jgi:hypothetical protein